MAHLHTSHLRILGLVFVVIAALAVAQEKAGSASTAQDQQSSSQSSAQSQPAQSAGTAQTPQATTSPQAQTKQSEAGKDAAPSTITIHTEKDVDIERGTSKSSEPEEPPAPMPKLSNERITKETRIMVMRSLNAEMVFARKALPMGQRGVVVKDGRISPKPAELARLVSTYGPAVKPGDRALITDVKILDKSIIFELNGGPKKKKKWYQRIEIGGMGGMTPVSQQDPNEANAHGTTVELAFDKFVPEMTGDQVRQMLAPILDFHAKSAAEAYLETVPPKVKQAIKDHQVLVGMNKEMVGYAKGRPENKVREKDDSGKDVEEWIYGAPPQEVQFIRFKGDEVIQVKRMTVDGQKIVKTDKEVNIENGTATLAKKVSEEPPGDKKPVRAPSLKRPGEEADKDSPMKVPDARKPAPQQDEEWGKPKTPSGTQQPSSTQPQDGSAPKTEEPKVSY
jgi:hypothetical protein